MSVLKSQFPKFFLLLLLAVGMVSCHKDCKSLYGEGGNVNLALPQFYPLNTVGGFMTINRGYRGIYIYRNTLTDFVACECACPGGHDATLEPVADYGGLVLRCPVCGSQFSVLDGMPLEGSETSCPVYLYNTHLDGDILMIW